MRFLVGEAYRLHDALVWLWNWPGLSPLLAAGTAVVAAAMLRRYVAALRSTLSRSLTPGRVVLPKPTPIMPHRPTAEPWRDPDRYLFDDPDLAEKHNIEGLG